jgi:menaquinone-9 beta-reductase
VIPSAAAGGLPQAVDVVVVGAGPAGSVTAMLLARSGHDVLLLDRARFPRPKACGDCLSAGAAALLHRLGLLHRVQALPHGHLTRWHIHAPGGTRFHGAVPQPPGYAMAVERELLDAELVRAAVEAGVRLVEGVRVTDLLGDLDGTVRGVQTDAGPVRARLTVGADGLRSIVARRLGALRRSPHLRKVSFTARTELALPEAVTAGEMHALPGRTVGIAPLRAEGGRCNVTVVAGADVFRRAGADPRAFFDDALRQARASGSLASLAAGGLPPDMELMASGPFDQPVRQVTFDGAALAGDAAGYYDPFTGQGVTHALLSAELLARTADGALRSGNCSAAALRPYARGLRATRRSARFVQRAVEAVLSRPAAAAAAIAALHRAPRAADALIAVIGLVAPVRSLFSVPVAASLLRSPVWRPR